MYIFTHFAQQNKFIQSVSSCQKTIKNDREKTAMQQFSITELIQQVSPAIATEVQYYYRRGTVFYFRSTTSQAKFRIIVAPKLLQETIAQLTRGNVYPCTR